MSAIYTQTNNDNNEEILIANTGIVAMSFDSENLVFTLDYEFTTDEGTVNGYHESEFIIIE